jgi:hypothetical protein
MFQNEGYLGTCSDNYIDDLAKSKESMKYTGKNVQTLDGKKAYVTNSGFVKLYADDATFNGTAGLNGCPTTMEQLNVKWDQLGFPKGSAMVKGQTCGSETEYVTASPPQNNFDGLWYRTTYPQLKLTTDEDALNDWKTAGQQEGRLPNPTILKSMAALGSVGYIDVNTKLHTIDETGYSGLKSFMQRSNVTGKYMSDCTSLSNLTYGTSVVLASNDNLAYLTSDNKMKFNKTQKHVLILRPPPDSSKTNYMGIRFGDQISLANSTQNSTLSCGYYGCRVGTIDGNTWKYVFGPGGESGGTMLFIMPSSTAYIEGDALTYNTPFALRASLPIPNNAMYQSDTMTPGNRMPSADDRYYVTYRADGYIVLYKNPSTEIWKSDVGSTKPKQMRITATGNLEATDTDGVTYWSSTSTNGTAPFAMAIQTDGRLVMYDAHIKEVWSKGTSDGTEQNQDQMLYAQVNSDMDLVFTDDSSKQSLFSFQNTDPSKRSLGESCDLTLMQAQCKDGCVGFIHDGKTNEWQQIKAGAKSSDFKISSSLQDVYMKVPKVSLKDKSCKKAVAKFVDETAYYGYPISDDLISDGKDQCLTTDPVLEAKRKKYEEENAAQSEAAKNSAWDYDNSPFLGLQAGTQARQKENDAKMKDLESTLKEVQDSPDNETYKQQMSDSALLDRQAKAWSMVWAIIAVVTATFIAVAWYGGIAAAFYGLGALGIFYLGYRFFH